MDRGPAVHLFARKGSPLIAQLSLSLRGFVQVRWSERVPAVDRLETGDIFVVDLAELPPHLKPDDVAPLLDHGGLGPVPGGAPVMAHEGLPMAMARWRVGIGDTTNARRELRRAKKSSKDAFLKLRSLVA